jgi:hypothetical protein
MSTDYIPTATKRLDFDADLSSVYSKLCHGSGSQSVAHRHGGGQGSIIGHAWQKFGGQSVTGTFGSVHLAGIILLMPHTPLYSSAIDAIYSLQLAALLNKTFPCFSLKLIY